jgi:hypothetical protein
MTRRARIVQAPAALALAATLTLTGCGDDAEPEAGESTSPAPSETTSETTSESSSPDESPSASPSPIEEAGQRVAVTIKGDDVEPLAQQVEVGVGEKLVLEVTSDRAGELHVHSNPEQEPAFESGSSRVVLTFDKPGQVDVEEHASHSLILRVLVR